MEEHLLEEIKNSVGRSVGLVEIPDVGVLKVALSGELFEKQNMSLSCGKKKIMQPTNHAQRTWLEMPDTRCNILHRKPWSWCLLSMCLETKPCTATSDLKRTTATGLVFRENMLQK